MITVENGMCRNPHLQKCGRVVLYIVCHDDQSEMEARRVQEELCSGDESQRLVCHIARISGKTRFFENEIWHRIRADAEAWSESYYVGTVAYSCGSKVPLDQLRQALLQATTRKPGGAPDVMALYNIEFQSHGPKHVISAAKTYHGSNFHAAWRALLSKLGFDEETIDRIEHSMPGFYCNYWLARPHIMRIYLDYVTRAMYAIEHDPGLSRLFSSDARYYCGSLTRERLMEICGLPHYPLHPFVLERLPSFLFTYMAVDIERSTSIFYR